MADVLPDLLKQEVEQGAAKETPGAQWDGQTEGSTGMKLTEDEYRQVQAKRVRGHKKGTGHIGDTAEREKPLPVARPAPSPTKPPYKSKLELAWAVRLDVMRRQGEIDGWLYEPFTFRLAEGKRYRADFLAWKWVESIKVDGSSVGYYVTTAYECKGWHKNYRDSLTHLSWAAQKFPFFQWKKVVRNGKSGFEVYDVRV